MAKRVDVNQGEIVAALRAVGADWIPTSNDPRSGCDGFIAFRGRLHLAEIKDGSKPPSARKLTDTEQKRKASVERCGVTYNILLTPEQALRLIGAIK